jgi:hypothetical protein
VTIFGWDTSHFDGIVTLATAKKAVAEGIVFATAKVSESNNYDDPLDGTNLRNFRDAGVKVLGGYHVVRSGDTIDAQVNYYISLLDRDEPWWRDFPGFFHQVDLELWGYDNVSAARGIDFGKTLKAKTGRCTVMYASDALWNANYPSSIHAPFKALYPGDDFRGWNAYSGQVPTFLQYTSTATIGGLTTCDANAYRGTFDQLYAFITGGNDMTAPTAAQNQEAVWHTAGSTGNPTRSAGSELAIASRDATASSEKADQILAKLDSIAVGGIDMDAMRKLVSEEVAKVINSTNTSFTLSYTDGASTTSTS